MQRARQLALHVQEMESERAHPYVLKGHGAHELRARHGREPWVNAASPDLEGGALWQQVANVAQEILVGGHLQRLARGVVVVDLLLQTVALVQERLVLGRVLQDEPPKGAPKLLGVDPRAGEMSFSTSRTSFMSTFRPPLSSVRATPQRRASEFAQHFTASAN